MKLLPKSQIAQLKEREKAREAAEGLKIARRVDELRELQSNTEKKLNDFRASTLQVIGEDIKNLDEQRAKLAAEVSSLEKKLASMEPALGTTRKELSLKEKQLVLQEQQLLKEKESVNLQEIDVVEAKKSLADLIAQQKTMNQAAKISSRKAEEAQSEALAHLAQSKTTHEKTEKEKKAFETYSSQQKSLLRQKEGELSDKEQQLAKEQKEIETEKKRLDDRRKMIERTVERLRKQRINVE